MGICYIRIVATTPTVYGIETSKRGVEIRLFIFMVATTPTVYGIETKNAGFNFASTVLVATTPTVYGIETLL